MSHSWLTHSRRMVTSALMTTQVDQHYSQQINIVRVYTSQCMNTLYNRLDIRHNDVRLFMKEDNKIIYSKFCCSPSMTGTRKEMNSVPVSNCTVVTSEWSTKLL